MKINYKKTLKFVTLLITSLLISLVSAASYSELFMYATPISIGTAKVQFTDGANTTSISSAGITGGGTEVTFDNITIEPGETRTYEQAVNITNNAASPKTINISFVSLTGQWITNFDYINVTMFSPTGTQKGNSIEIVSSGENVTETGGQSIPDGEIWTIRWIIKAKQGAAVTESISITFKVKVE